MRHNYTNWWAALYDVYSAALHANSRCYSGPIGSQVAETVHAPVADLTDNLEPAVTLALVRVINDK